MVPLHEPCGIGSRRESPAGAHPALIQSSETKRPLASSTELLLLEKVVVAGASLDDQNRVLSSLHDLDAPRPFSDRRWRLKKP